MGRLGQERAAVTEGHRLISAADIVVDVGCADWNDERSVDLLIHRFAPRMLFGFDPTPAVAARVRGYSTGRTRVEIRRSAAWTKDGWQMLHGEGSRATLVGVSAGVLVECFDLARWLQDLSERVILKLDCEGGEYRLLSHLIATGQIKWVERLLVEWHDEHDVANERPVLEDVLARLRVPVEEWR
jgi:FkbM family methyltransferase